MIDLHCHLRRASDDGPGTLEEALQMAQVAVADGVERVICTPHINHAYPANSSARIAERVEELRAGLAHAEIPLSIAPGAEIALTRALELDDEELRALSLAGSGVILLELPNRLRGAACRAARAGHPPRAAPSALAHPERCLSFSSAAGPAG